MVHRMVSNIEEYLKNPCRYSALPFYKEVKQNNDLLVIHNDEVNQGHLKNITSHKRFFRIFHDLRNVDTVNIQGFVNRKFSADTDIDKVIAIINGSYSNIRITSKEVNEMIKDTVYHSDLWNFIIDESTGQEIALGICQYDEVVSEVVFDWIQVLPEYRGKGIASMLVTHLLSDVPKNAKFATVSGDMDNPSSPEKLYKKCGFTGNDVWYIIKK